MSRVITQWSLGLGAAMLGAALALTPNKASADDIRTVIRPAVVQTTSDQPVSVNVQPVGWRRGWGPGVGVGVYRGPWGGARVYVGPRYGAYYRPYRPYYYGYGYSYPAYGYGYAYPGYGYGYTYPGYTYGYAPYGYW